MFALFHLKQYFNRIKLWFHWVFAIVELRRQRRQQRQKRRRWRRRLQWQWQSQSQRLIHSSKLMSHFYTMLSVLLRESENLSNIRLNSVMAKMLHKSCTHTHTRQPQKHNRHESLNVSISTKSNDESLEMPGIALILANIWLESI